MQPAAHYSAAIEIMEEVLRGASAEQALLSWARSSRFAGSKDRAAVRDIVFECLRKQLSYGFQFGATARGIVLGRASEARELELFSGEGYAPKALSAKELAGVHCSPSNDISIAYDFPSEFIADLHAQYGDHAKLIMLALRERAPVDLRVNIAKTNIKEAQDLLARDYIFTEPLPECATALRILENPRKLQQSRAFNYGFVELQDVSSQMAAELAKVKPKDQVLDYCAGGGGKTLALGMHLSSGGKIDAWDIAFERMKTIPDRAARAGLKVNLLSSPPVGQYDLVFVDAPCSGSGAWRRAPGNKFRLTRARLNELCGLQSSVIEKASQHVRALGRMIYATCSLFEQENRQIVEKFLKIHSDFVLVQDRQLTPLEAGDGFYMAELRRL